MLHPGISISIIIMRGRLGFSGDRISLRKHKQKRRDLIFFLLLFLRRHLYFFISFYFLSFCQRTRVESDPKRERFDSWHRKEGRGWVSLMALGVLNCMHTSW
ncbi:hypothetical protein LX32DRAFT_281541 [Colletotrichum zoysiae]|uniref:Transmembrane protein n=1 Tax=Colletotrichum zoysiae TaxID=1216348 RepID=A0AAD9H2P6_9PEZI|nr:hypothetical protein LX32DRAFT_281541 [Colletotrichum zoysiae]